LFRWEQRLKNAAGMLLWERYRAQWCSDR